MYFTDRVIDQQNRNRIEKNRKAVLREDPEEDDMGYAYMPAPKVVNLNTDGSVFDTKDEKSINTAPSIFDRTAIFHVSGGEEQ